VACEVRIMAPRDVAVRQDSRHPEEESPRLDDSGRIRLPDAVRSQRAEARCIAIEIRPEGVLLRPEVEAVDDTDALLQDILPLDAPPEKRRWRLFGWRRRQPEAGP